MSVSSPERKKRSDETGVTSVDTSKLRFVFPYNPYTKTLHDIPGNTWQDEAADVYPYAPVHTLPMDVNHNLVPRWPSLAAEIVSFMDQNRVIFCGLELYRRSQDQNVPSHEGVTVLVTVNSLESLTVELLNHVCKFINRSCDGAFVEFCCGEIYRLMDFQLKDGPLKQPYRQRPQLGSSISAYDIEGATGTLGGYLKLIMPNNTTKFCALTCHHVLRPPTGSSSKVVPPEYRIPFNSASGHTISICHPSLGDHMRSFGIDQAEAESCKVRIDFHREKIEMLGDDAPSKHQRAIDTLTMRMAMHEKRIPDAAVDRVIGTVLATSGYHVSPSHNCVQDWGLILLQPHSVGTNALPENDEAAKLHVLDVSEALESGEQFIKYGRSTGKTKGVISPCMSFVRFPDTDYALASTEMVVMSRGSSSFSEAGDTGAWVLEDESADLVGMLWGGLTSREGTFVTPIKVILDDIASSLGCTVELLRPS